MSVVSMKQLLEAGVHFGHQTRRWNPKMDQYIYTSRGGIHIVDLQKTVVMLEEAYQKLLTVANDGGKILVVGTKKQARDVIKAEAVRAGQFYVTQRWLGGTLTNFKTIRKSIRKLHDLNRMEQDGTFDRLTKKEVIVLKKEIDRLEKFLSGIKDMRTLPQAVFVVDPIHEKNAVLEAKKLGIPVFGIVDTNCDPDLVDVIIPGNDDAIRSIKLIASKLLDAFVIAAGGDISADEDDSTKQERPERKPRRSEQRTDKPERKERKERKETKPEVKPEPKAKEAPKPKAEPKPEVKEEPKAKAKEEPKAKAKVEPKAKEEPKPEAPTQEQPAVDLASLTVPELKEMAKERGMTGYSKLRKAELIDALTE